MLWPSREHAKGDSVVRRNANAPRICASILHAGVPFPTLLFTPLQPTHAHSAVHVSKCTARRCWKSASASWNAAHPPPHQHRSVGLLRINEQSCGAPSTAAMCSCAALWCACSSVRCAKVSPHSPTRHSHGSNPGMCAAQWTRQTASSTPTQAKDVQTRWSSAQQASGRSRHLSHLQANGRPGLQCATQMCASRFLAIRKGCWQSPQRQRSILAIACRKSRTSPKVKSKSKESTPIPAACGDHSRVYKSLGP